MILLIGGESCTGKTLLAQRMMERFHVPYTSLDHLKMGLIRGLPGCPFKAEQSDAAIAAHLWPIAEGMILTALENGQHLILEGCYLPPAQVKHLIARYPHHVQALYLAFSDGYIRAHWEDGILAHRNAIEQRQYPEERSMGAVIAAHASLIRTCRALALPCLVAETRYEELWEAAEAAVRTRWNL